jgi:uncharacterized protein (DUF433 family)
MDMVSLSKQKAAIIRTERGLTIAGTRITLYDLMDFITAGYPLKFIRDQFDLTDEQFEAAMSYIEANRAEVEAEYRNLLQETEENRKYWEERNREFFARIAKMPAPPGMEAAWEKLQKEKARLESQA